MSKPMSPNDPCYFMLSDGITTTPIFHRVGCFICEDLEFAQMGLPLCYPCSYCEGHVPADSDDCDDCGKCQREQEND